MAKRRMNVRRIGATSNAMEHINAALPKWLDADQRHDVSSAMYLALADGRLKVRDITASVAKFVTANNRQSQNIGRFGFESNNVA